MRPLLALLVGLLVGSCGTLVPVAADSKPKPEWRQTKVSCRGNGAGGFRQCGVRVYGKVDKVVYDLWINGEYHGGIIYEPFE